MFTGSNRHDSTARLGLLFAPRKATLDTAEHFSLPFYAEGSAHPVRIFDTRPLVTWSTAVHLADTRTK